MALFTKRSAGQAITIKISGAAALEKRLKAYGNKIKTKALKKAFREMGKPIVKSVAAEAPKDLKILSKSIRAKVLKSKRTKNWSLRIGPQNKKVKVIKRMYQQRVKLTKKRQQELNLGKRKGQVVFANPSKYSHLVALGTSRGASRTNYLQKGLNRAKDAAVAVFIASMKLSIAEAGNEVKGSSG